MLRTLAPGKREAPVQPGGFILLCALGIQGTQEFQAAGLAALHPPGLLKVPGLDYCGFSPSRAVGPLSLGALGLGAACVCISYRCWSGLCGPGRQGSVQEKVTHCRGQKKKKPGEAGRRLPPLPAPLSCLGPGGISPFLGAWSTLTTCPFPLGKGPGLGVEAKKKESVTSSRGAKVGCCLH